MTVTTVLGALCASAAVVLLGSGLAKIVRPQATAVMLGELMRLTTPRLPRRPAVLRPVGRLAGVGEVAVAVLVLTVGGRLAPALLAAAYLVFALVAVRLAGGGRPVSCGCFGRDDSPVGRAHIVVTVAAATVATAGAIVSVPVGGGLGDADALAAAGGGLLVLVLAGLTYLSMTALPALSSARRLVEAS